MNNERTPEGAHEDLGAALGKALHDAEEGYVQGGFLHALRRGLGSIWSSLREDPELAGTLHPKLAPLSEALKNIQQSPSGSENPQDQKAQPDDANVVDGEIISREDL